MPSSRGSSQPRDGTQVSRIAGGFFTVRATREALVFFSCFSPLTLHLKLVTETELFSFSSYIYLPLFIFIFPEMFTSIFAYLRHTSPNSPFLPEHTHTRPLGSNDYFFWTTFRTFSWTSFHYMCYLIPCFTLPYFWKNLDQLTSRHYKKENKKWENLDKRSVDKTKQKWH